MLLCIWKNYKGVIHYKFTPDSQTIDAKLYSKQLECM